MCVPLELKGVLCDSTMNTLKTPAIKYPKDQLTLASVVFVAINKSYFSVYTQLKKMTLHLASVV